MCTWSYADSSPSFLRVNLSKVDKQRTITKFPRHKTDVGGRGRGGGGGGGHKDAPGKLEDYNGGVA